MKNYIELRYCEWIEDCDDRVKFFDRDDRELVSKIVEFTEYCNEYMTQLYKKMTIYNFIDFLEQSKMEDDVIKELWISYNDLWDKEEEDWSIYQIKLDMIDTYKNGSIEDLVKYVDNCFEVDDFLKPYIEFLGYQFGTVGYSPWAYYIAINKLEYNYIDDLWNGSRFYDVDLLDEQGEVIEGLCQCYLTSDEDLEILARREWKIDRDNINLIKNENSEFFNFKQYAMIPASYDFIEVK